MRSPGAIARNGVRDRLADPVSGWNPTMETVAPEYGIAPLFLSFAGASRNVEYVLRDPEDVEESRLHGPLTLSLGAESTTETGQQRYVSFSGETVVFLQFNYLDRVGPGKDLDALIEISEQVADAIEDCLVRIIGDPAAAFPGSTPARRMQVQRGPSRPLSDGVLKPILVQFTFGVTL